MGDLGSALDRVETALTKLTTLVKHPGHSDQSVHGRRGPGAPSPGGKESYNDRIEGTQKEADREVGRADKAVGKALTGLTSAYRALDSLGSDADVAAKRAKVKQLEVELAEVRTRKERLTLQLQEVRQRIAKKKAEYEAKYGKPYKSAQSEELAELNKLVDGLQAVVKQISKVADDAERIAKALT